MPGINADDTRSLVFRTRNESAAGISPVDLMSPEYERKQEHGSRDKPEYEPNQ